MRLRAPGSVIAGIALAAATAACAAGPTGSEAPPASVFFPATPIAVPPPSTGVPAAGGATDLTSLDAAFETAIAASLTIPFPGLSTGEHATPTCQALGSSGPPGRMCIAMAPSTEPIVTFWVIAAGSVGGTAMLMAYAGGPDAIEGTRLPAPSLGDEATLARTWSQQGCRAVLAVRKGTLILSVQVRLEPGPASSDCGVDVPADWMTQVARTQLDQLAPFGAVGMPVDDPAARGRVVRLIEDGTLKPGERDLVTLPAEFAELSDTSEVVAFHTGDEWTVVFFEVRGLVDFYSGWVYRSSGTLGPHDDPLGGQLTELQRIDDHWFHVVAH